MRWRYRYIRVCGKKGDFKQILNVMGPLLRKLADIKIIETGSDHITLKIRREYVDILRAAVALAKTEDVVWIDRVSGTLKSLRQKSNRP